MDLHDVIETLKARLAAIEAHVGIEPEAKPDVAPDATPEVVGDAPAPDAATTFTSSPLEPPKPD